MMTYREIQERAKKELGRTVKTCWIADVKRELGMTSRIAYNRKSSSKVVYPCPDGAVKQWLLKILKPN
ncbi:MAG: hypothetical protein CBB72_012580 [Muricauda sp. TMED12]|nr:MAG: hypothetical protein CBB72_012580 [Muricauda sp. TMED12]